MLVIVPDNQLSLAIGKKGQNARLAAKLTGFRVDIKSEGEVEEERRRDEEERAEGRQTSRFPGVGPQLLGSWWRPGCTRRPASWTRACPRSSSARRGRDQGDCDPGRRQAG